MRLLVSGGAGLIGANFVHRTVATCPDVQVSVPDALTYASSEAYLAPVAARVEFVPGDMANAGVIEMAWWRPQKEAVEARCAANGQ